MEPKKLNHSSGDDVDFDRWLRSATRPDEIPDDGFTGRVLHALPRPVARHKRHRRVIACLAAGAMGLVISALAVWSGPHTGELVLPAANWAETASAIPVDQFSVGALTALLSLAYVFRLRIPRVPRWFVHAVLPFARARS